VACLRRRWPSPPPSRARSGSLGRIGVEDVRGLVARLAEQVAAEEVAAKTVNNTLGTLVVCLNSALEDGLIATNRRCGLSDCPPPHRARVPASTRDPALSRLLRGRLPPARRAVDRYWDANIEALALRVGDVELEPTGGLVTVYRSQKREAIGSTKSDRFRSVETGPALARVLADQLARRAGWTAGPTSKPHCSSCRYGSATTAAAAGRARARRAIGPNNRLA